MAKYTNDNSIEGFADVTGEILLDEDLLEAEEIAGIDDAPEDEAEDMAAQQDYAFPVDDEDLAWDLPDSGDEPELDAEEAAAWEAGTLALLDAEQNTTDRDTVYIPDGDDDRIAYEDGASIDAAYDHDEDDSEEYRDHSGYPYDEMPAPADEDDAEAYHDHSGYPYDEMPAPANEDDAEEYHDHSGYPYDEMPAPADEIYTEELPDLEALMDTSIVSIHEEDLAAGVVGTDTDALPPIDDDAFEDTTSLDPDSIRIIDESVSEDTTTFDTASIEILDEWIPTDAVSSDTDMIEIVDADLTAEAIGSDTDVIQIIDEGIPTDTDLIPIISTEDIAGTDELEIEMATAASAAHSGTEQTGASSESGPVRKHRTALDYAVWAAAAAAAALAVIAGLTYYNVRNVRAEAQQYQTIGSALAGVGTIGEDQITAIRASRMQRDEDRKEAEQKAAEKAALAANEGTIPVTMALSTVQSDLKIKIHGENGSLISDVPFKVEVTLPTGKTAEYEDDDQDGIIYQTGLSKGTYKVTMEPLVADAEDGTDITDTDAYKSYSQYKIPTDTQSIEVKDKIAYAAIDVSDEIKTTAQVNVAAEDTQHKIATESEVQDTVEYVESTTTAATTSAEEDALYETVDKSEIVAPNTSARADLIIGRFHMLAEDSDEGSTEAAAVSEDDGDDDSSDGNSGDGDSDGSSNDGDQSGNDGENNGDDGDDSESETRSYTTKIKGNTSVAEGGTTLLTASTDEPGATTYTWELDGDAISIDRKDGKTVTVTGEHEGTATLTATAHLVAEDADPKENVVSTEITVTAAEESGGKRISVSPSSVTLSAGKTQTLSVSVEGLDDTDVSYESAEPLIAEISSDGTITAHTAGETTVTVTANGDSSLKQSVKVKVVETETNEEGNALLKDKDGNQIYVKDNGAYREATAADYDAFDTFYRKVEGKAATGEFKYTGWQNIGGKTYYFNSAGEPVTGNQVINGASYTFGSDGALTSGTSKVGIDVSQWNGSINWSSVASSGISYAIVRCGYRGSSTGALIKDPNFATNMAGATAAGLKVGIYVFSQAVNEVEAVEEASMAISMASGYGVSLPIFIDVEAAGGRADSLTTSQRTAVVSAFCQTVQASGYSAGIYSNTNWLTERVNTPALTSYHIWVAQYSSSLAYSRTRYDIWQYSSKGHVAGISGDVDMNMSYRSY